MAQIYKNKANANAVLTLAAQGAGTLVSPDMDGSQGFGVYAFINVTAISGTSPTLTVTIQGKDDVSGQYYTMLAGTAITATGFTVLKVYPGLTASAGATANDCVPVTFNVKAVVGGTAPSVTATISTEVLG